MTRAMRVSIVLLLWPAIASAQFAFRPTSKRDTIAGDSIRRTPQRVSLASPSRARHMKVGAITGVALGATAGLIGGSFARVACLGTPCQATRSRVALGAYFTVLGAVAGGITGTAIGAAIPAGGRAK